MKTKLLFLLLAFLLTTYSTAQNKYSFSKTTGNIYNDLAGDINVTHSFVTSTGLYTIPGINGEIFNFFDLPFPLGGLKTISVGEGPFLRIDNDSSLVIVDVAFTNVDSIDPTSKISYLVQGTSGNKILKTQYKNLKLRQGQSGNFINVQIWYFQQSGIIELHYGPRSTNNAAGYTIQNGPNVGIFYSPDNFSGCYEKLWCNGSPAALTLDSASNYVFKAMNGVPDAGTIYRFSPRSIRPVDTASTVGLKENPKTNYRIAPNPVKDKIFVSCGMSDYDVSVCDLTGRIIKTWQHLSGNANIDVAALEEGWYFIQIVTPSGTDRKKVLVSR